MDAAERALLRQTIGSAVAEATARAVGDTVVDGALAQLGWREMLHTEPRDAVEIVFEVLGQVNATATALDDVVLLALGVDLRDDRAVLLPRYAEWHPPGRSHPGSSDRGATSGCATARVDDAEELVVVHDDGDGLRMAIVPRRAARVTVVRGIDPHAGLRVVEVEGAVLGAGAPLDDEAWESAIALGRRAVAHQISGASRAMLELACEHARERVQFDRPIARFQAVRHRLADALVSVEALDACLAAAGDEPGPETAALAKAVAGRTALTVAAHCQQVLAGVGFTTDHPFHRFLKRTIALEGLFGTADEIVVDVGRRLLRTRQVPTLVQL
jgi:hypothetical protein